MSTCNNICIVIPVYEHADELEITLARLCEFAIPIIVVDDGSSARYADGIRRSCGKFKSTLLRQDENAGKGAAVINGLHWAYNHGYTHALQIDSDCQHDVRSLPEFVQMSCVKPDALILGYPRYDHTVPHTRKIGRWATHMWVWINTLSFDIKDSMCGFRVYPLNQIIPLTMHRLGRRMDFDIDIAVRACWQGIPIVNLPVSVTYPANGKSHFNLVSDNIRISFLHTRLFLGMLRRLPRLVIRSLNLRKS